ncbi:MAG: bifunctional phosphoribosylaminoimidazolecarboxamide formyltransferase/inosine monophosphate cyclohydrolase [Acidiferrobacteraceae bacterium]|nr:bifunctional phosphoribosylaminoimidazolecarboxamide formyltransferase/inosine monophosphate cyclohydrolase [Acidiferrobacteraceae bacterium]|tara:strand:+ start:65 stop:1633 length:1569 start_codon:yes stop_codon:yes gene_type:complete
MSSADIVPIKRALISVSDKSCIIDFAKALSEFGIEILSTGGTGELLRQSGIAVIDVSDFTGMSEFMGGRVKTLHPKIHGGILGDRRLHVAEMADREIRPIDLVVVNLYPFEQTIAKQDVPLEKAIENIDIGGPTMLRAAAKNNAWVTVIVSSTDYRLVLSELGTRGGISSRTRNLLASKAFKHTAHYDGIISNYLEDQQSAEPFPEILNLKFAKSYTMRYGENPHQRAAFYQTQTPTPSTLASARKLQGKELSFNNLADADAALDCVRAFPNTACAIVKHANPCGVAVAADTKTAYELAYQTDPLSAFGGIIAFNRKIDRDVAAAIIERQFVEVIIAPEISTAASKMFSTKPNIRILSCGELVSTIEPNLEIKQVSGGLLVQDHDSAIVQEADLEVVTRRSPTDDEMQDLLFAWKVAKYVKSNAIVLAKQQRTVGVGAGQMSRIDSARIAGLKAKDQKLTLEGSVMASDAFFPFRDAIDSAATMGVTAIIEPGGSMRDEEVIDAANTYDMAVVFTKMRHFRH